MKNVYRYQVHVIVSRKLFRSISFYDTNIYQEHLLAIINLQFQRNFKLEGRFHFCNLESSVSSSSNCVLTFVSFR